MFDNFDDSENLDDFDVFDHLINFDDLANFGNIDNFLMISIQFFTWCDDDNSAKESDFGIGQAKMVHPLGQLENGVHEELCISRRHAIDGVLPYDVSIKTNQALQQINMTL